MTTRSYRFVPAGLLTLILLVCCPLPVWSQTEQPQSPASAATSTVAVPQAGPPTGSSAGSSASAAEQSRTYTIKERDTLWDIANAQYRDPFLWPLIWKANPSIADPDRIYPGVALVIPSLAPVERAMAEPQEAERPLQEQAAPAPSETSFFQKSAEESTMPAPSAPSSGLVLPKESTPPIIDKYAMISAGFVSDEPSSDRLLESVVDPSKKLMGYNDDVYIDIRSRQDVKVGDRFLIYRPDHTVKHPVTGKSYGPLNIVIGILRVTAVGKDGHDTARIVISFDDAEHGDLLTPYQEPELLYPVREKRDKDLTGYLLEVRDYRRLNAQADIVYLDKGKVDGVDPGDVFIILAAPEGTAVIPKVIGEGQVLLVKERTATAVVRKSTDTFGKGYQFRFND